MLLVDANHPVMTKIILLLTAFLMLPIGLSAQASPGGAPEGGSMALAPARFELEMQPGTEITVVVNLDYRSAGDMNKPARIVASLNDWNISRDGRVEYFPANSRPNSASPWILYSPGEASVMPGTVHQIRVTVAVPLDAAPGDHLAALIVEQRPNTLRNGENLRQMVVRYRMASVFYIKVGKVTRKGNFEDLYAEIKPDGIVLTPVLKNEGNSVIRPVASVLVIGSDGKPAAEIAESESLPILGGSFTAASTLIPKPLPAGLYTVKYKVDFRDGRPPTEGVTELVVRTPVQIASQKTDGLKKP